MAAEDLLGDLAKLADRAGGAFGAKIALAGEDAQNEVAGHIAGKTPLEALYYLAGRLAPAAESTVIAPVAESSLTPAEGQHGSARGLQADTAEADESIGESVNFVAKAIAALAEKAEQMAADAQAQADSAPAPEPTSPPPAANPTNQPQRKPTRD
jgi:hypothetical protein